MEKKLILALILSVAIILTFQFFTVKPPIQQQAPIIEQTAATSAAEAPVAIQKAIVPMIAEEELIVETGKYTITFSNIGGAIKGISLKDFKEQGSSDPLTIARIKNPSDYILNISSVGIPSLGLSGYTAKRTADGIIYTLQADGWEISKRYILNNTKRGIALQVSAKNISSSAKELNYRLIGGAGMAESNGQNKQFVEVTSSIDGKTIGFKRSKAARIVNPGSVKWSALKNKYFSFILKPLSTTKDQFYSEDSDGMLVMGVDTEGILVQPGATVENKYILYIGPSHIPALKEFGYDLDETINYGFFGGISKVLIVIMRFFYSIVHSWGLSIIFLSIFLNVLLFPLTLKSFSSMQKMQALHPQMEKLKVLHKNDPQKLNKEIMELYKKYKINPLSGCLPMLLQMPIFIALYQALMKSIELRNTKFLWIQDLSSPDAVRIPLTLPIIGNSINILPLLMVGAMVAQQKMSSMSMGAAISEEQKQQQKMMLILMPIMFGFIFYNMPSGLVMYWLINTVLTIVEQRVAMKNSEVVA